MADAIFMTECFSVFIGVQSTTISQPLKPWPISETASQGLGADRPLQANKPLRLNFLNMIGWRGELNKSPGMADRVMENLKWRFQLEWADRLLWCFM
jgi:hypothetical protein